MELNKIYGPLRDFSHTLRNQLFPLRERVKEPFPILKSMSFPVSEAIYARLSESSKQQAMEAFDAEDHAHWQAAAHNPALRRYLLMHFGVHHGVASLLQETSLQRAEAPADVHAMARGRLTAGGSFYYADLLVGALQDAGVDLPQGARLLDFGASSGRVVRVLKAWREDLQCLACDPNGAAVAWAAENLGGVDFFQSPLRPPLKLQAESLDLIYAVSIWSHFNEVPALLWLEEMHRLLKPGAHLVFSLHGLGAIAYYARIRRYPRELLNKAALALGNSGFFFWPCFGEEGDWGVKDTDWGEAYMSVEWLANRLSPKWKLRQYRSGFVEQNQDLVILEKNA